MGYMGHIRASTVRQGCAYVFSGTPRLSSIPRPETDPLLTKKVKVQRDGLGLYKVYQKRRATTR